MLLKIMHIHITWVIFQQFKRRDLKPVTFPVRIFLSSSMFESPQKTSIRFFSKKLLHKCLFKIPLWREIDNATPYFSISSKYLKWKQHFHSDTFWNYLLLNMAVDGAKYQEWD